MALAFGKTPREALLNARASLAQGFAKVSREYQAGWRAYLKPLRTVDSKYQQQFNMAAMTLKGLEDKTYRGAMIASPSVPWGGGPHANEPTISGYHAVWARDLYQVATAFLALGDRASANRALDYLFNIQQKQTAVSRIPRSMVAPSVAACSDPVALPSCLRISRSALTDRRG